MEMPMKWQPGWTSKLAVVLVACLAAHAGAAAAAESAKPPTFDAVLERLGYTAEDKAALLAGKIVATDLKRTRDDQLVAAVAVLVKAPLEVLDQNARMGLNIERDEATTAFGRLDGQPGAGQFSAASFYEGDRREVERLFAASADGTFNLSKGELEALNHALPEIKPGYAEAAETASRAYQTILAGRYDAYLQRGLDGIDDYQAGARLAPAGELRGAYDQVKPFLDEHFPDFTAALGRFPAAQSPDIHN